MCDVRGPAPKRVFRNFGELGIVRLNGERADGKLGGGGCETMEWGLGKADNAMWGGNR